MVQIIRNSTFTVISLVTMLFILHICRVLPNYIFNFNNQKIGLELTLFFLIEIVTAWVTTFSGFLWVSKIYHSWKLFFLLTFAWLFIGIFYLAYAVYIDIYFTPYNPSIPDSVGIIYAIVIGHVILEYILSLPLIIYLSRRSSKKLI